MDYKILLNKYMAHVDFSEGTMFLSDGYLDTPGDRFSEEEIEELKRIATEIEKETE